MIETASKYANAAIGSDKKVLQDIRLKSKNIAIYERNIESLDKDLLQVAEQSVECRASGSAEDILSELEDYFSSHLLTCPSLFADVSELLRLFAQTTQASSFRLMLATISNNMCRKFHTDVNNLRLLCTYIGPGTLWVPDEAIDHQASQARGNNQEIVMDLQQIQQVRTGSVAILKGALYPDGNPVLHRSPSIEEDGARRLLLRIDTNEFLSIFQ